MTKAELVSYIAKDCKISKAMAENVLNSVTHNVSKCLRRKDKITLRVAATVISGGLLLTSACTAAPAPVAETVPVVSEAAAPADTQD